MGYINKVIALDCIGSSGQTLNYQSKRYTVINGVKVSSKWMACFFKHYNNELPGLENNFFRSVPQFGQPK